MNELKARFHEGYFLKRLVTLLHKIENKNKTIEMYKQQLHEIDPEKYPLP